MNVAWCKVWRDLLNNKARTVLVVLSTAVGVFALGVVFGLYGVMNANILRSYQQTIPAHITLFGGPFDRAAVDAARRERGIAAAMGETTESFHWKLAGEGAWREGDISARPAYDAQPMNLLQLQVGHWPDDPIGRQAGPHVLVVERFSADYFDLDAGDTIVVEFGEYERRVVIVGVAKAPVVLPPAWGGVAAFFATPETAAWLSGAGDVTAFEQLHVLLDTYSEAGAREGAERIRDRLEHMDVFVAGYETRDPAEHWVQDIVDGTMAILGIVGLLSLGLSAFLIINTMNAILVQQVWQIGVMKTIGATIGRLIRLYLAMAFVYGGLALALAVPLGALGAYLLAVWLLDNFNIALATFQFDPTAVLIQVVVGLAVPLGAALIPVIGGVRTTVQEAIRSHGMGGDFGQGVLDRAIGYVRCLPRPLALSLRNTFRRKARVALTLLTLLVSGAMFTMVLSTRASLDTTIINTSSLGEDISVKLDRPRRRSRAVEIAERVPGVVGAEVWTQSGGVLLLPDGREHAVDLTGLRPDSAIFDTNIVQGRGLRPGDDRALIFTSRLAAKEGVRVGDRVSVRLGDDDLTQWTVVGLYLNLNDVSDEFFVPIDALEAEIGSVGRGRRVKVRAERNDLASQQRLIEALERAFAKQGIEVVGTASTTQTLADLQASFGILTSVLLAMVALTATVGGIGLMSTMSMNVVERQREIGVMRAIGASTPAIVGMFVAEGVMLGALSWLLAVPLSYPGARLFSDAIGLAILNMPLNFVYSAGGMLGWLVLVVLLSAMASLWPALRATHVSVRAALAYE